MAARSTPLSVQVMRHSSLMVIVLAADTDVSVPAASVQQVPTQVPVGLRESTYPLDAMDEMIHPDTPLMVVLVPIRDMAA